MATRDELESTLAALADEPGRMFPEIDRACKSEELFIMSELQRLDEQALRLMAADPADLPEPRKITCKACARGTVELADGWANECPQCGTEYNGAGQRLADRRHWRDDGADIDSLDYD